MTFKSGLSESTRTRVFREAWLHLWTPTFGLISGLFATVTSVIATDSAEDQSRVGKIVIFLVAFIIAYILSGLLVTLWVLVRVPYWQRDEARKVANQIGQPSDSARQTDARLLAKFLDLLPSNGAALYMMRTHDFGARWFREDVVPLRTFALEWNNSEHEFIDPELEQLRKRLLEKVDHFWSLYSQTGLVRHDPERSEVPRDS